ncbi:MAG: hypothetical protein ABSE82_10855 [Nitrososphaerales archaeon]|jgi:hypothetical protein
MAKKSKKKLNNTTIRFVRYPSLCTKADHENPWKGKKRSLKNIVAEVSWIAKGKQSHPMLRKAISMIRKDSLIRDFPAAFRIVIWELMKTQTRLAKLEARK